MEKLSCRFAVVWPVKATTPMPATPALAAAVPAELNQSRLWAEPAASSRVWTISGGIGPDSVGCRVPKGRIVISFSLSCCRGTYRSWSFALVHAFQGAGQVGLLARCRVAGMFELAHDRRWNRTRALHAHASRFGTEGTGMLDRSGDPLFRHRDTSRSGYRCNSPESSPLRNKYRSS